MTDKPFYNFFKILSDPAEGYKHLVNKIMASAGPKRWSLDFYPVGVGAGKNHWCLSSCKSLPAVAIQNPTVGRLPRSRGKIHKNGLTLIRHGARGLGWVRMYLSCSHTTASLRLLYTPPPKHTHAQYTDLSVALCVR